MAETVKLHHQKLGNSGPTLVILHGLYGQSDNWISIARSISGEYCVYLVDQRNHGHSPHHPVHNYEAMVADLNQFFNDHHIAKAHLLGHSMGGKTAMHFALTHPQKVDKLIVADIAPKSYATFSNYAEVTNNHLHILQSLGKLCLRKFSSRLQIDQELARDLPDAGLRNFLMKNIDRDDSGLFYWRLNLNAIQLQLDEIMDGFSQMSEQRPFTGETIFVCGAQSPYVREEDMLAARRWLKDAQLVTIPSAGHWLHAEQPTLFVKTLNYFLLD